jgi:hypothetical protein
MWMVRYYKKLRQGISAECEDWTLRTLRNTLLLRVPLIILKYTNIIIVLVVRRILNLKKRTKSRALALGWCAVMCVCVWQRAFLPGAAHFFSLRCRNNERMRLVSLLPFDDFGLKSHSSDVFVQSISPAVTSPRDLLSRSCIKSCSA